MQERLKQLIQWFQETWGGVAIVEKIFATLFFGAVILCGLLFVTSIFMGWWYITLPMATFVILAILFIVYNYRGAEYNIGWFTTIKEGTGKEIVMGGNFVDFIPNRKGVFYNKVTQKIEPALNGEDRESLVTKLTGRYFIGWNPLREVRQFPVLKTRLKKNLDEIEDVKDMIEVGKEEMVDHLRMVIERSTLMLDVDLKDRTRLYVLVQGIYDVYGPYRILEELDGKFYSPLQGIVRSAILKKYGQLQLPDLGTLEMTLTIQDLIDQNIQEAAGLTPTTVLVVDWSLSDKDQELQNAAQQRRIQEEKAAGREAEARGEAAYIRETETARAETDKLKDEAKVAGDIKYLEALKVAKLDPHTAEILAFQQVPGLRTLVKGGKASVILPPNTETEEKT